MTRILLNADLGERGRDHPVDHALMEFVDIANIACGGHAGTAESVETFTRLAAEKGCLVSAHLSYPDAENFGRKTLVMPLRDLLDALKAQLALFPDVGLVKFHGALYNDSCRDRLLAESLAVWLKSVGIMHVITQPDSQLDRVCREVGINVIAEVFAERRYCWDATTGHLALVSRARPEACIHDYEEALVHVTTMLEQGKAEAFIKLDGSPGNTDFFDIRFNTICIHSDSPIALELARAIAQLLRV